MALAETNANNRPERGQSFEGIAQVDPKQMLASMTHVIDGLKGEDRRLHAGFKEVASIVYNVQTGKKSRTSAQALHRKGQNTDYTVRPQHLMHGLAMLDALTTVDPRVLISNPTIRSVQTPKDADRVLDNVDGLRELLKEEIPHSIVSASIVDAATLIASERATRLRKAPAPDQSDLEIARNIHMTNAHYLTGQQIRDPREIAPALATAMQDEALREQMQERVQRTKEMGDPDAAITKIVATLGKAAQDLYGEAISTAVDAAPITKPKLAKDAMQAEPKESTDQPLLEEPETPAKPGSALEPVRREETEETIEAEILDDKAPTRLEPEKKRIILREQAETAVFAAADYTHEDDDLTEKEDLMTAASALYVIHTDEPLDLKRLLAARTRDTVSADEIGIALGLAEDFKAIPDKDLIDNPRLPLITGSDEAQFLKEQVEEYYDYLAWEYHNLKKDELARDDGPKARIPVQRSGSKERTLEQTDRARYVEVDGVRVYVEKLLPAGEVVTGPNGERSIADFKFGPPGHEAVLIGWQHPKTISFQIKTRGDSSPTTINADNLRYQQGQRFVVLTTGTGEGEKIVGWIDGATGNVSKNNFTIEDPNVVSPYAVDPAARVEQSPTHTEVVLKEEASPVPTRDEKSEVATNPGREPQDITGRIIPRHEDQPRPRPAGLYWTTNPDGTERPMTTTERVQASWQEFLESPKYPLYRAIMGAPVDAGSPVTPTLSTDLALNSRRFKEQVKRWNRIRRGKEKGPKQGWASSEDLDYLRVDPFPGGADSKNRIRISDELAAPKGHSVLLVGRTESGKDQYLAMNAIVEHMGPTSVQSVKHDTLLNTIDARAAIGPVYVFAPLGFGEEGSVIEQQLAEHMAAFNPIAFMGTYDEAGRVAHRMAQTSTTTRSGETNDFWNRLAEDSIKLFGWMENKRGGNPESLLKRINSVTSGATYSEKGKTEAQGIRTIKADFTEIKAEIIARGNPKELRDLSLAESDLNGFTDRHEKQMGSIMTTAQTMMTPYKNTRVLDATSRNDIDPAEIIKNRGTVYMFAPAREQAQYSAVFNTLASMLTEAALSEYTSSGKPNRDYLLNVRGEMGHGAVHDQLETDVTTGRAQGVMELIQVQTYAQLQDVIGQRGVKGLFNNTTPVLLPGTDDETEEFFRRRCSTVKVTKETPSTSKSSKLRTTIFIATNLNHPIKAAAAAIPTKVTVKDERDQDVLEAKDFMRLRMGQAIVMTRDLKPTYVTLKGFHDNKYADKLILNALKDQAWDIARQSRNFSEPSALPVGSEGRHRIRGGGEDGQDQQAIDAPQREQQALERGPEQTLFDQQTDNNGIIISRDPRESRNDRDGR